MFRRYLASHYALILSRDNPPVSQSLPFPFSITSASTDRPYSFTSYIRTCSNDRFHVNVGCGICPFSLLCSRLRTRQVLSSVTDLGNTADPSLRAVLQLYSILPTTFVFKYTELLICVHVAPEDLGHKAGYHRRCRGHYHGFQPSVTKHFNGK
jgi:hypothetical protein